MNEVEMEHRITAVEKLAGSNRHRLEEVEARQDNLDNLVASVAVMAKEQEHIKDEVVEIKNTVKTLAARPARRWDGLVDKVIMVIASAVVGFILAAIGLGA